MFRYLEKMNSSSPSWEKFSGTPVLLSNTPAVGSLTRQPIRVKCRCTYLGIELPDYIHLKVAVEAVVEAVAVAVSSSFDSQLADISKLASPDAAAVITKPPDSLCVSVLLLLLRNGMFTSEHTRTGCREAFSGYLNNSIEYSRRRIRMYEW